MDEVGEASSAEIAGTSSTIACMDEYLAVGPVVKRQRLDADAATGTATGMVTGTGTGTGTGSARAVAACTSTVNVDVDGVNLDGDVGGDTGLDVEGENDANGNGDMAVASLALAAQNMKKVHDEQWNEMLERLKAYRAQHGDCLVPKRFPPDPKVCEYFVSRTAGLPSPSRSRPR